MEELLPSASIDRADYRACRTTYGCLSSTYKRSSDSNTPEKEYKELQALGKTLRHRLSSLDADRGLPRKFKGLLDDLKSGVDGALDRGVSTDFLTQGLKDSLEDKPDATPAPKPCHRRWYQRSGSKQCWTNFATRKRRTGSPMKETIAWL